MSDRSIPRAQPGPSAAAPAAENVVQWGSVVVEPAAAKSDGQSNAAVVPEMGARIQGYNGTTWDRIRAGMTAVVSTFVGFLTTLPYGRYVASRPTLVDGQGAALPFSTGGFVQGQEQYAPQYEDNTNGVAAIATKPLANATYSWTRDIAFASNARSVKASTGNIKSCHATNQNAAVRYLQVFNKASAPAGGDVPVFEWPVAALGGQTLIGDDFFGEQGYNLTTGIALGVSTTSATYTAATAGDHVITTMYK